MVLLQQENYTYNRPIYWDKKMAQELLGDTEVFDIEKSEIATYKHYFENQQLIYQTHNPDTNTTYPQEYLQNEQERLFKFWNRLKELL